MKNREDGSAKTSCTHTLTRLLACLPEALAAVLGQVQPLPFRSQKYNRKFRVATMDEFLQIALVSSTPVGQTCAMEHACLGELVPRG